MTAAVGRTRTDRAANIRNFFVDPLKLQQNIIEHVHDKTKS